MLDCTVLGQKMFFTCLWSATVMSSTQVMVLGILESLKSLTGSITT